MAESQAISILDVNVLYGEMTAIENINLQVETGEFFGLIGLNGAGKTTLIKTLLGLRTQDSGEVYIHGRAVNDNKIKQRLAFLPERFEPSWFLSGIEFLKFSAALYNHPLSDEQCIEYAQRVSLDPTALKRRVQTYSKGMRQKLGLLGTILTGCDILILDEPMSGLDPVARAQVKALLQETKNKGCTIFLSSHILADMDEICDRVAVLHDKKIRYTGTAADLKKKTKSKSLEQAFLQYIEEKAGA